MAINHDKYTPRPGSVPHQVLSILQADKKLPPSKRINWTPAKLARKLGVDVVNVRQALRDLCSAGLAKKAGYVAT